MATDPQDIIDAIDAAILDIAVTGKPQTISTGGGRSMTCYSLKELQDARDRASGRVGAPSTTKHGFRLTNVQLGGSVPE